MAAAENFKTLIGTPLCHGERDLDVAPIMLKIRHLHFRYLGRIVPAAEGDRGWEIGGGFEPAAFRLLQRPPLQLETLPGRTTQLFEVFRLGCTQILLRRHVETDGFDDGRSKVLSQPSRAEILMPVIDAPVWCVVGQLVQQMAHIVQQSRRNQLGPGIRAARKVRRLQRVLLLSDGLAAVIRVAALRKEPSYGLDDGC